MTMLMREALNYLVLLYTKLKVGRKFGIAAKTASVSFNKRTIIIEHQ